MFLASNVTKVTVISGWNGSYGSMRPGGHISRGGTDKKLSSVILLERKISQNRPVFSFVPAIF